VLGRYSSNPVMWSSSVARPALPNAHLIRRITFVVLIQTSLYMELSASPFYRPAWVFPDAWFLDLHFKDEKTSARVNLAGRGSYVYCAFGRFQTYETSTFVDQPPLMILSRL